MKLGLVRYGSSRFDLQVGATRCLTGGYNYETWACTN